MSKKKRIKKGYGSKNKVETKKIKRKVRKIRYGRVLLYIILPLSLLIIISSFVHFPIKNIYILGNNLLTDQEIIELAGISDYPSIFEYTSYELKNRLEKNQYIDSVKIRKRFLREVYIEVKENIPLFSYSYSNKTVFSDNKFYDGNLASCVLLNYVPEKYLDELKKGFIEMNPDVRNRISEIQYVPNDVDDKRFFLTMNDGNYVYITLNKIDLLKSYLEIIRNVDNKKGILYLDSGEYFEIKN